MTRSTTDLNQKFSDKKEEVASLSSPIPQANPEELKDLLERAKNLGNTQAQKLWDSNWGLIKQPTIKEQIEVKNPPSQKVTIQHIKQMHMPPIPVNLVAPIVKERVARSQYQIAKIILANPSVIVLTEGLYEDFTPEVAKQIKMQPINMFDAAKAIFPTGIPDSYCLLAQLQKDFLAELGAAKVLFYLDQLTHIYKTTSEKESKNVDRALARDDYSVIFEPREKQALFWAKQAAVQSGKNNILLIYGAAHDFEKYKAKLSEEGIELRKSIETRYQFSTSFLSPSHEHMKGLLFKLEKELSSEKKRDFTVNIM